MTRIDADWLRDADLQRLLAALSGPGEDGGEAELARVVGGAIRNTILGQPVSDIDIATTCPPAVTVARATAAGFKTVPTGIEHGTVTVIANRRPFEVTTLRRDVETNGRHAVVAFGRDWQADAERRDFTINALYCEADGTVVDLVGGLADIERQTLRFIGDASARIEEDYLRILRFFRFFAWYGAGRPDGDGLRAVTRLKGGLTKLSAERVWAELRKLLAAPDPSRALLWARQTGVLTLILPESERWGIDGIHGLMAAEQLYGWPADPLLRLECIVPPDPARLAELSTRLKLSNVDRDRLKAFAEADPVSPEGSEAAFRLKLYFADRGGLLDRLRLQLAVSAAKGLDAAGATAALARLVKTAESFDPPSFPVTGADLQDLGMKPGKEFGAVLQELKLAWVESGFVLSREKLLARVTV